MKKISQKYLIIATLLAIFSFLPFNYTYARPDEGGGASTNTSTNTGTSSNSSTPTTSTSPSGTPVFTGNCDRTFLGFKTWDCGVTISDQESLKTGIWVIVANVLTDITILASYLVIGYVIYGGYLYVFSSGDPGKVATGKKTLTQAFIGLAIVLGANVIMNSIRIALLGASGSFAADCANTQCIEASDLVTNAIQWVTRIVGFVAAIFVVYGGISYSTSAGDPGKIEKAKKMITYALIGLVIVALAEIITAFVTNIIKDANKTSIINETSIGKEIYEKNH